MDVRTLALIVHKVEGCDLLKAGDRWMVSGREVKSAAGVKLCGQALCSIYPHLQEILATGRAAPSAPLWCTGDGCATQFIAEDAREAGTTVVPIGQTRRMERRAMAVGAKLRNAGPFMTRVSPEAAVRLMDVCSKSTHSTGEVVLPEGIVGDRLYIVGDGEVEVVRRSPRDGSETLLVVLGQGECFGEMSMLTGELTSATVRARGETVIFSMTREQLEDLLSTMPALNRVFSQLLAERLREVNTTLESELGRGILGKLSMISFIDLVQTLNATRRTGTLVINRQGLEARVGFRNGQVVSGELADFKGEDAFFVLVAWPEGDFAFEPETENPTEENQIEAETMGLLMEGLRRLDDAKRNA